MRLRVSDLRLGRGVSPNFQPRGVSLRLINSIHLFHGFEGNSMTVALMCLEKPKETVAQGGGKQFPQGFYP